MIHKGEKKLLLHQKKGHNEHNRGHKLHFEYVALA